jgi:hypothetical protein
MSKRVSAARPPAAKNSRPTRTSKPPELKLYRLKNPDFYDKAVAADSEAEARKIIGGDVELIDDAKLLRKIARRPGVVFRKLSALKRDWEAWT